MKRLLKFLTIFMPIALFIILVWIIFVKLKKDMIVEIEGLISNNKWTEAITNIENVIRNNRNPQIHLYVFGSVAIFGIEEEKYKAKLNKNNKNIKLRDYNYELIRRDSTGLYLRESFFYRFKKFPNSKRIVNLLCDYLDYFPDTAEYETKFQKSFLRALNSKLSWEAAPSACLKHIFDSNWSFLKRNKLSLKGKSEFIKTTFYHNSQIIQKIMHNEKVLIRKNDISKQLSLKKSKWIYVMGKSGKSGWIIKQNFLNL